MEKNTGANLLLSCPDIKGESNESNDRTEVLYVNIHRSKNIPINFNCFSVILYLFICTISHCLLVVQMTKVPIISEGLK